MYANGGGTNTSQNGSDIVLDWKDAKFLVKNSHYLVITLLIIAVNTCVIVAVWKKRILHKWQNYLLVSLACSDLSTGLFGLPLVSLCTFLQQNGCLFCSIAYIFTKFISISTILHLLTVTYERYLFIVYPFHHERLSNKRQRFKQILAGLWLVSLVIASIPLTWLNLTHCSDTSNETEWLVYTITTLVLFLIVPMFLFIFAFGSMFMVARIHIRKQKALITRSPGTQNDSNAVARKETRVAFIFVLMWVVFVICWSPYFALNITEQLEIEVKLPDGLWEAANVLRFLTSLLNPLLYSFLKKDFCQALGLTCVVKCSICRSCCLPYDRRYNTRQQIHRHSKVTQRMSETGNQGLVTSTA